MKKKIILSFSFLLLFFSGCGLGIFIGNSFDKRQENQAFVNGWNAARKRLVQTGILPAKKDIKVTSISGKVEEVNGNRIKIKIVPLDPFDDPDLDLRIAEIIEDTAIYQIAKKTEEQYQKELKELGRQDQKKIDASSADGKISRFYYKKTDVSDIKKGKRIRVDSADNIRYKKSFAAKKIIIIEAD